MLNFIRKFFSKDKEVLTADSELTVYDNGYRFYKNGRIRIKPTKRNIEILRLRRERFFKGLKND